MREFPKIMLARVRDLKVRQTAVLYNGIGANGEFANRRRDSNAAISKGVNVLLVREERREVQLLRTLERRQSAWMQLHHQDCMHWLWKIEADLAAHMDQHVARSFQRRAHGDSSRDVYEQSMESSAIINLRRRRDYPSSSHFAATDSG